MPVDQQTQQTVRYLENLAARMLVAEIAWAIIGTLVFFGLLYFTLRYAIRDGLRDAQREDRRTAIPRERDRINAPDMRAD